MQEDIAMLFLHGGKQGDWIWDGVYIPLALQGGETVPATFALDLPGCGCKHGRKVAALTLANVVDELAADIAAIDAPRLMMVGHSQAGTALPRLADAVRPRVIQLTYIACAGPAEGQSIGAMLGGGLQGEHVDCIGWPIDPATSSPRWQERFAERLGATRRDDVDAGHQLLQTRPQTAAEILLSIAKDYV